MFLRWMRSFIRSLASSGVRAAARQAGGEAHSRLTQGIVVCSLLCTSDKPAQGAMHVQHRMQVASTSERPH